MELLALWWEKGDSDWAENLQMRRGRTPQLVQNFLLFTTTNITCRKCCSCLHYKDALSES